MQIKTKNFIESLEKEITEKFQRTELIIRKVAFDTFSKIIDETPINTGLSKSSWMIGFNFEPTEINSLPESGKINESEAVTISQEELKKMDGFKLGDNITFINNTEYLIFVEYGSPKVSAVGMVETNIQLLENKLSEALK